MDNIRIATLNARGLGETVKRRRVFRYMKAKKIDVILLQETHCVQKKEFIWSNEWGNKCLYSNGSSNARGVAILLSKKCANNIEEIRRDMDGRYILCKVKIQEYSYCIGNVYAPNVNDAPFFNRIFEEIKDMDCIYTILGGDYNVVLKAEVDRSSNVIYNNENKEVLLTEMENLTLVDIWRQMHTSEKKFTWMRGRNKDEWSRIDFFLVSSSLVQQCQSCDIHSTVISDHSMVSLELCCTDLTKRGPGCWKFNNELLNDELYCREIENIMRGVSRAYEYMPGIEFWEMFKFEITNFTREFARNKEYDKKGYHFELNDKLNVLQQKLLCNVTEPGLHGQIDRIENELTAFEIQDARRSAFRCRLQYTRYGEVPSKYYFNMEKRNFLTKTMYVARRRDGTLTKDYREILNLQHDFYSELYKSDEKVNFTLQNLNHVIVPLDEKARLDSMISIDEMYDAVMTLKGGKTPGGDGITVEFYRKFWKLVSGPLHKNYVNCMENGALNPSGKRGIINLIPKKSDPLLVKNWRGISLLNYDYKIWAKALSNRLEENTQKLIGLQQTGFIKGRSIFTNIRTTAEIVCNYRKKQKPGVVILIDFEKCFDRVEYESIRGAFRYFGFGDHFINMLFLLFNQLEMCTVNNGYYSNFFNKNRGTNQGCPASPQIFCYCSEIMSHLIYQNSDIQGLHTVNEIEQILSQFADDTSAYLKYEDICIKAFVDTLTCVEGLMGLKVSYEKTSVYRIGSLVNSNAKIYTQKELNWTNDPIATLGVYIDCDGGCNERNFTEVLAKARKVCNSWVNRRATLMGKIVILNTLISSLFVYKMFVMNNLTKRQLKEIEGIFRNFLWNGKKAKIGLSTLMLAKEHGGLRLSDISARQDCFKISWIFRDNNEILGESMFQSITPELRHLIWKCNLKAEDVRKMLDTNLFWVQVLLAWCKINHGHPSGKSQILDEILWMNSHIVIQGKPFVWRSWLNKGIINVNDILDEYGRIRNLETYELPWLEINQMLASIPARWMEVLRGNEWGSVKKCLYDDLNGLTSSGSINRRVYNILIFNDKLVDKYRVRWSEKEELFISREEYLLEFNRLPKHAKIIKYRDFQYRVLLCKIVTNADLNDWGMRDSDSCHFCSSQRETLKHLFYECTHVRPLLQWLIELCEICQIEIELTVKNFILSHINVSHYHIINFVCTYMKQFIYRKRCNKEKMSVKAFEKELTNYHEVEFTIAKMERKVAKHKKRWGPIFHFPM